MIGKAYNRWMELGSKYSQDSTNLELVWNLLQKKYSEKSRHYHNLSHVWAMLNQSKENRSELEDADVVDFSIWFHDIIYKSTNKDNEKKSAEFAKSALESLSIGKERIEKIDDLIVSTKKHQVIYSDDIDNAYLLDFDLSILGKSWKVYENYIHQIRKEYKIYPNFLYNPGRKKVLMSFLERETLYFTAKYQNLYERKARENLKKEINLLTY